MTNAYRRAGGTASGDGDEFCPSCGARVPSTARRCGDCGGTVATARCESCLHVNHPHRALCAGCGHPLSGLQPVGSPDTRQCPRCRCSLERFDANAGALLDCSTCGGQFVETALLWEWLERRQANGRAGQRPPRANPLRQPVTYLQCPCCAVVMNRKNFGGTSGIIVDVCVTHGVWFDVLELPRVFAYAEAGGLELARTRLDERARERASQRLLPAFPAHSHDDVGLDDLLDWFGEILRKVTTNIRR